MRPIDLPLLRSLPPELLTPLNIGLVAGGLLLLLILVVILLLHHNRSLRLVTPSQREPMDVIASRLRDTGPTSPDALQGGLRHMPLPDLLQFLAQGRRTGDLEINSGRREGIIRLVQGMVVHAEYRRTLDLEALFGMLSLESGDFVFTPTTAPDYQVHGREVVDILMLWLSRKDTTR